MAARDSRPSSTGSIKRSNVKIPAEGLTVLPPEPGLVKFESVGITRPTSSTDSVRVGTAQGCTVERSLQVARKTEPEVDIPIGNNPGLYITGNGMADYSVASTCGNHHLTEHEGEGDSQHSVDSESSDTNSSDSGNKHHDANVAIAAVQAQAQAPVELKGEFLKAVMDEEFEKAKELCQKILLLEPDNKTCSEFHAVICEKMKQDDESGNSDDDGTEESDESCEDESDDDNDHDNDDDDDDNDIVESSEDGENDDDDDESESDDDIALLPGPINLIMGGLPIRPQKR